jgi:hypothetical protein
MTDAVIDEIDGRDIEGAATTVESERARSPLGGGPELLRPPAFSGPG